jgi:methionyl-tRNA formyltransferase
VPVQLYAEANAIPFQTVATESLSTFKPASFGFDLLVAVSFGLFILPRIIYSIPHSINVHPSLLPQYRGPAPIHHAILNGDRHTGVTLQTISSKGFDRGIIFDQSFPIAIEEDEKFEDLWRRLANLGADMLVSSIRKRTYINPQPVATFTKESEAGKIHNSIDWYDSTGDRVERLSRLFPPTTGAIDIHTGRRIIIKIRGISHRPQKGASRTPGTYFMARERVSGKMKMVVVCSNKDTVFVEEVKVSGKDWIPGTEFVNSSADRFWGSRFVPWRKEYDEHDPTEYAYQNPDVPTTPSIQTNSTDPVENTTATVS